MRILIRIGLALVLLAVLGVAALAVFLPRLVQSDVIRARIAQAARDATGREVSWGELDIGVLPPRVVVSDARMAGATSKAPAMVEGADVELRLSLLPLLARSLVVDSLRIEGATVRLVRTRDGIQLPEPDKPASGDGAGATGGAAEPGQSASGGFALAVRGVSLAGARVILEDRTVSPAVTWDLQDLDATLRGRSFDDPVDVDASGKLASGGRFSISGRGGATGPFTVDLKLDDLVMDPAAPYLEKGQRARGRVSGTVRASGTVPDPDKVTLDLVFADAEIAMDDVAASGSMKLKADLSGGLARPDGTFELDATGAKLRYGNTFHKEPGMAATAAGRIVTDAEGNVGLDDTRLRVKNLEAGASLRSGKRQRLEIQAKPFDLDGWEKLLPALAESAPVGRVGFENLVLVTEPPEVRGRITLDDLRLARPGAADLRLRGALVGEGAVLRGDGLVAHAGKQAIPLEVELRDPLGEGRLRVQSKVEGADTNLLLSALAGRPDTLLGLLNLDTDLRTAIGGSESILKGLSGPLRIEIRPGQIKGVSLLKGTLDRLGSAGEAVILAGRIRGGSTLQRFYGDEFESLTGTFQLGAGRARTDDLRVVYRNYSVDLRGGIGLEDLALDMSGTLTIGPKIDAVLAGDPVSEQDPASIPETATSPGRSRTIPLAKVRGTLDAPQIDLSRDAIVTLAASYTLQAKPEKVEKYEKKIDEVLGEGTGQQVRDALEGLLGGGRKR